MNAVRRRRTGVPRHIRRAAYALDFMPAALFSCRVSLWQHADL